MTGQIAASKRSIVVSEVAFEQLDEAECLRLIAPGGVGRLVFAGRYDLTALPVNYKLYNGAILFRTAQDSATDEDLRTRIAHAEYRVAFEVDEFDMAAREGWSVLVQGPAHHLDAESERAEAVEAGVEPWPGGDREHFISITPASVTGRRIRREEPRNPSTARQEQTDASDCVPTSGTDCADRRARSRDHS
jgi:nitroimidazol reductase NimA-like FMN-containing flavoprotein (pyridoxamine 5'-phosphate oxidase superfamily)